MKWRFWEKEDPHQKATKERALKPPAVEAASALGGPPASSPAAETPKSEPQVETSAPPTGSPATEPAAPSAPEKLSQAEILKRAKDPAFLKQARWLMERMTKEGVNVRNPKQVQEWVEKNKDTLTAESSQKQETVPKQETVRYSQPQAGRNDPCPCGSGKKYKKCHLKSQE